MSRVPAPAAVRVYGPDGAEVPAQLSDGKVLFLAKVPAVGYAVFDVRERGEFNECQIPHASSLPRSQIEFRIAELVPDRTLPIVLYGDGDVRAPVAAAALACMPTGSTRWPRPPLFKKPEVIQIKIQNYRHRFSALLQRI